MKLIDIDALKLTAHTFRDEDGDTYVALSDVLKCLKQAPEVLTPEEVQKVLAEREASRA